MTTYNIDIHMDEKCSKCGHRGTVNKTRFCMDCCSKIIAKMPRPEPKPETKGPRP